MYADITHKVWRWLYVRLVNLCDLLHREDEAAQETVNESIEIWMHVSETIVHLSGPVIGGGR